MREWNLSGIKPKRGAICRSTPSHFRKQPRFGDPLALTFSDPDHSGEEDRYLTFGLSSDSHYLVVSHTDRGDRTRVISARRMTRKERKSYEEGEV